MTTPRSRNCERHGTPMTLAGSDRSGQEWWCGQCAKEAAISVRREKVVEELDKAIKAAPTGETVALPRFMAIWALRSLTASESGEQNAAPQASGSGDAPTSHRSPKGLEVSPAVAAPSLNDKPQETPETEALATILRDRLSRGEISERQLAQQYYELAKRLANDRLCRWADKHDIDGTVIDIRAAVTDALDTFAPSHDAQRNAAQERPLNTNGGRDDGLIGPQSECLSARGEAPRVPAAAPLSWENAAMRFGEKLAATGPDGYYSMTPAQWLDWCESRVTQSSIAPVSEEVMEIARWWAEHPYEGRKTIRYDAHVLAKAIVATLTRSASGRGSAE